MATTPTRTSASTMKKNLPRAPQKRTFHFFMQVVDEQGNVIPGAKLKVERIISDARKVIEFMDTAEYASLGLTRVKHEVIATKRGEEDGASSVG